MAPIRRYLRISKYSVLECRIFLENPADGPRWLLKAEDPALPRVFEAIRPLVLPKLREENERAKGKGKKKKSVKDVVKQDDFEVSIFLTEIGTRHSLLVKSKTFGGKGLIVDMGGNNDEPVVIREDSEEEERVVLEEIPSADSDASEVPEPPRKRSKRTHQLDDPEEDDKKKLGFQTSYEGFSIWGLVLCLLVERKGSAGKKGNDANAQALMQEWIASTQQQDEE